MWPWGHFEPGASKCWEVAWAQVLDLLEWELDGEWQSLWLDEVLIWRTAPYERSWVQDIDWSNVQKLQKPRIEAQR